MAWPTAMKFGIVTEVVSSVFLGCLLCSHPRVVPSVPSTSYKCAHSMRNRNQIFHVDQTWCEFRVKKTVFFQKSPTHWAFLKKNPGFSPQKTGFFKNPILVDFGDVLLGFEGFKNKPDQWVLKVLLFWVFLTFLLELGVLNAVHFKYWINVEGE